jgi:hypothetical protein
MSQPTSRELYVDPVLTQMSIGYKNPSYIADELAPMVTTQKQSGIVPKYDQSHWFRNEAKKRASGTKSQRGGLTTDLTDKFYCDRFSFGFEIEDDVRDNAADPFNLDRDGTEFVTDKMLMAREIKFVTDFWKTSVWGTDKDGTANADFTQFSDYGASDPLGVISDYKDVIEGKIAREPNVLAMGKLVYTKLKWHPDLIDLIKYTQRGQLTPELIASLLEFDKLLIGRAIYTTDPEGTAEASVSYTRVWGKNMLMLYRPERPSLMTPAAIYTFVWQRVANALQYIKRMRDEEREVDIIEGNSYFDQKVTAAAAGLFMKAAVA